MMKKYKNYIIGFIVVLAVCISICFLPINASGLIPEIEKQAENDFGVKVHIEKLIFRFGPSLKLKAPKMHILYEDGQKVAQFDNVKFFINWSSLFKKNTVIKRIYADKFIAKVNSNDKYLQDLVQKFKNKKFEENPNIQFMNYNISYFDKNINKKYQIVGNDLNISKIMKFKNYKFSSIGDFFINDKKYVSYNISVRPNISMPDDIEQIDLSPFLSQIEALEFYSDIYADIEIYKNMQNEILISGLANIDNISVLDLNKKAPTSFLYLTFWGKKVGISSNIYTSSDKKAIIDGSLDISKKKSIDLKVKTDEIRLKDLHAKLRLFADMSFLKGIDSVDGLVKADFFLKGDINKIKSSGFLKITNASLKASGIDVNKIDADIDFSNNVINITNAIGYVKNAPIIFKGKIDKNIDLEVIMNRVELSHLLPSSTGVKSGIASLVAKINGTSENIIHKENIQIDNFKCVQKDYEVKFNNFKIDTNKDNTAIITALNIINPVTATVKFPLIKLHIDKDSISMPLTNSFMQNSKISVKADVLNYNSADLTFNLVLDGFINSKDINKLSTYSNIYPVKANISGNKLVQNIAAQLQMDKATYFDSPTLLNLNSKIEKNTIKIDDLSVLNFSGNFLSDLKSNLKGNRNVIVSGNIENLKDPEFKNIRIMIPQIISVTMADTVSQLKGDLFINGKISSPEIIGQLTIQNLINQFMQLSANNITVDFNKYEATINAPQIKLADTTFSVNSVLSANSIDKIAVKNLNIKSKYLNTDTLLMYEDRLPLKNININLQNGNLYAEKVLTSFYGGQIYLSALNSGLNFENDNLKLNNLSAEMLNGKIAGEISFDLINEMYKAKIQARNVSASPIFEVVSPQNEAISGVMDFDAQMEGNLLTKRSISGNTKFIIHNGRMGTLGKLEHLLYAQNVISDSMLRTSLGAVTKAITLKDTGLFKYLRGDIDISNGVANIKLMQSQGPLMAMYMKGQYNLDNASAKLVILGRISDEIVEGLGAFGDFSLNKLMIMLTGDDKKYNLQVDDYEKIPQLSARNTREFRAIINGIVDKPSSVALFNWVSTTQKSYRQKDVPMKDTKLPDFVEALPY